MPPAPRSVVVHGHFYQPPREDPWRGAVPRQPSAAPDHDWNARVTRECYAPVTSARILDGDGEVRRRLNALELMSFDFGPTLLAWLEPQAPEVYAAVLEADRVSCARLGGHGNALAMPYHHTILPLASPRDRRTEIRWGVADFRRRFGREPEGMWLPETAVDSDTLAALAAEGIRFTVLAPHQVARVPTGGRPGRVRTAAGEIAVFVYDGALSHSVAFGDLARDGARFADVLDAPHGEPASLAAGGAPTLRSICTDGETYGHHHAFAEMGLAAALERLEAGPDVRLESFASFLAAHPPTEDVELVEPTSWSCAHGVERWRSDCGCRADPAAATSQAWRAPLREALGWFADRIHEAFEREAAGVLAEPWDARDAFGSVVGLGPPEAAEPSVRAFLASHVVPGSDEAAVSRALELLELERDALRLFTSCAWFFDDVARLEPTQVLTYAAHALDLLGAEERAELAAGLRERLGAARANEPADGSAADVLDRLAGRGGRIAGTGGATHRIPAER